MVSEEIAMLVFATYGLSAGRPNTDHYIDSQFHASEKRKVRNDIPETYQYSE